MLWTKRPPKPEAKCKRGDLVQHRTQAALLFVVDTVHIFWAGSEWYSLVNMHRVTEKGKVMSMRVSQESIRVYSTYDN